MRTQHSSLPPIEGGISHCLILKAASIAASQGNINIKQWLSLGVNAESEEEMNKKIKLARGVEGRKRQSFKDMSNLEGLEENIFVYKGVNMLPICIIKTFKNIGLRSASCF